MQRLPSARAVNLRDYRNGSRSASLLDRGLMARSGKTRRLRIDWEMA